MTLHLPTLVLLTMLFSTGCKTIADVPTEANSSNQIAIAPTPTPTSEPAMPILKEIASYKASRPSSSPQETADYANGLLPKYGFEYDLDLERIITRKIKQHQTKPVKREGDDWPYVKFDLDVTSTSGAKRKLAITAPADSVCCCGYYYTPISVTKITAKELTVVIDSQETVIARPKDIPVVQEYIFGKEQPKPSRLRSWEVPYETHPYGVSADGKKLYIEIEFEDLLLEISETGILRFVPKDAKGIIANGEDLNKLPPAKVGEILRKSGEFGLMRYVLDGTNYIVEFPYPCT